ncbi:uncharacterized protein [Euwallacea similis]|uniref:uncharacterized protein n=1 Tax=Euwallacea similis TaxID=1736056 RepID=UPI00344C0549
MQFIVLLTIAVAALCYVWAENPEDYTKANSVYDFTVEDIKGNNVSLDKYKGNVLIIVNVASNCGLTEKNYEQLNTLYDKYEDKGLRILAFPCNQFLQQEPGTNEEIAEFAANHNVTFDMFSKIDVNGDDAHPLYKFLKYKQPGTTPGNSSVEWNFAKFIVDKEGQVVERHIPKKDPLELIPSIEKYL